MSQSLFSTEYFQKRGSWSGEYLPQFRISPDRRSSLQPYSKEDLSTCASSRPSVHYDDNAFLIPIQELQEKQENWYELSLTQQGSRYIQEQLSQMDRDTFDELLDSLLPYMSSLMTDKYANYMCQNLFNQTDVDDRVEILYSIRYYLSDIAKDPRGTHSLQSLICLISTQEEQSIIAEEFSGKIVELSTHNYATHVIQKLIACMSNRQFLIEPIVEQIEIIACDKLGLCVLKQCMSYSQEKEVIERILEGLTKNLLKLVQDPYGNYAIQHMLELWGAGQKVGEIFRQNIAQLSVQKFSSNVVEKCIEVSDPIMCRQLVEELLKPQNFVIVLNSIFGAFVIRTAHHASGKDEKVLVRDQLQNYLSAVTNKKLIARYSEMIKKFSK